MLEPAMRLLPRMSTPASRGVAAGGNPTRTMVPKFLKSINGWLRSCGALTVSTMRSKVPSRVSSAPGSLVAANRLAPRRAASFSFSRDVLSTVTSAPMETANLTTMWPKPPRPTTATWSPRLHPNWRTDECVGWHDWKLRVPPVVVRLVHVAVANATVENFDLDVVRSRIASLDRHRRNRRLGCAGAIGRSLLGHGQGRTSLG